MVSEDKQVKLIMFRVIQLFSLSQKNLRCFSFFRIDVATSITVEFHCTLPISEKSLVTSALTFYFIFSLDETSEHKRSFSYLFWMRFPLKSSCGKLFEGNEEKDKSTDGSPGYKMGIKVAELALDSQKFTGVP